MTRTSAGTLRRQILIAFFISCCGFTMAMARANPESRNEVEACGWIADLALTHRPGISDAELLEGARHSTMDELANATAEADQVLIF